MEAVYFLVVAIALYFVADWLLRGIEAYLGRTLENRTVVFFFLLMGLALTSFALIRQFLGE